MIGSIYSKNVARTFWAHFFGRPYHSNGTKIHLDAGLIVVVAPRKLNITCSIYTRSGRKIKSTHAGIQPLFFEEPEANKQGSNYFSKTHLIS